MRRISSSAPRLAPSRVAASGSAVRHYGVQPMSVRTMGLLPRGEGFLFQKEEGATSHVQQLNRIYILDKEMRDLLRSEARTKPQQATAQAAAPSLSPSDLVSTTQPAVVAKKAKVRSAEKPIREARASRKAVGSPTTSS